jgi:ATP-dependent RNA helicase DeaD
MQSISTFEQLALDPTLLRALNDVGYETPSPIQAETIPLILERRDVLGEAQTGTGKTAAFALPILSNLDLSQRHVQVLVLAPTRELAIQVAEAFQKYAKYMTGFHVLPVYGGQDYRSQIRALERGVHIVVGTPGRVMDHMRRGTLKLDRLSALVLDEADEMLRMGFIDDVDWILEQTPENRQIALFSATMPKEIRRIATAHLNDPAQITIKVKTTTAETIRQRYWPVSGLHKLDALTRILEAESFDAMLIFVRTKIATVELAEKLEARGFATAALNGDIPQNQRERTVDNLKTGKLDIIVATDVAARGLDVPRISHVVNYDIPYDTEAYVHRIGRTGRAGREGDAILFVAPREKRMLSQIERATRKKIERMELPSTEDINDKRINRFKQRITDTLATEDLSLFTQLIEQYQNEHNVPGIEIAAALAKLSQGDTPLLIQNRPARHAESRRHDDTDGSHKNDWNEHGRDHAPGKRDIHDEISAQDLVASEQGMERFRIQVGRKHKVKPGNIVGAIANEADLDSKYIGRIEIFDYFSLVDLPEGMPKEVFNQLKKVWVSGQQLNISRADEKPEPRSDAQPARKTSKGKVSDTFKRNKTRAKDRKSTGKKNTGKNNTGKKNTGK